MLTLYQDPWYTFRFDEDRVIQRFHLDGMPCGQSVTVYQMNPATCERLGILANAMVGSEGWVDLPQPIRMRAGEAFLVMVVGER